ncbi:hypothetical protein [Leifsonia aquatica]|uniref:phage tail tube protein n=1 Tax=Leifsonia aquatica TaxID=144185 RepID=UPI00046A1A45|nr:hypothetical protein [Leifsonia aquatica]
MTNNNRNAVVGKPKVSGGLLVAPVGTVTPTDEVAALDPAFGAVGYLTDSGLKRGEKTDSETKNAWGGDPLITIQKSSEFTSKFGMAEYLNPLVQSVIYGAANVTTKAATTTAGNKLAIKGTGTPSPHNTWVVEMFSGDARGRIVYPDAQITDREDVEYKDEDIAARGVTLTLFPDATGAYFYEYWDDGQKRLASS